MQERAEIGTVVSATAAQPRNAEGEEEEVEGRAREVGRRG